MTRTAPLKRSPIKRKARKTQPGDDPIYKAYIATLPCYVCYADVYARLFKSASDIIESAETHWRRQKSPTEVAHIGLSTSLRGLSSKFPDRETAPLCGVEHHRLGEYSVHLIDGGIDEFFAHHGVDRDGMIRQLQAVYATKL